MNRAREWLRGKKAYLTGILALVGAVVAWAEGGLNDKEFVAAVFVALQTLWIRAAVADAQKAAEGVELPRED